MVADRRTALVGTAPGRPLRRRVAQGTQQTVRRATQPSGRDRTRRFGGGGRVECEGVARTGRMGTATSSPFAPAGTGKADGLIPFGGGCGGEKTG